MADGMKGAAAGEKDWRTRRDEDAKKGFPNARNQGRGGKSRRGDRLRGHNGRLGGDREKNKYVSSSPPPPLGGSSHFRPSSPARVRHIHFAWEDVMERLDLTYSRRHREHHDDVDGGDGDAKALTPPESPKKPAAAEASAPTVANENEETVGKDAAFKTEDGETPSKKRVREEEGTTTEGEPAAKKAGVEASA